MADARLNVDDQFDAEILDSRRASIERLEQIAQKASGYGSKPVGDWAGTVSVSIAAAVDAARADRGESLVATADLLTTRKAESHGFAWMGMFQLVALRLAWIFAMGRDLFLVRGFILLIGVAAFLAIFIARSH